MKKTNEAKILLNAGGLAAKDLVPFLKMSTGLDITVSTIHNRKRSGEYELLTDAQRSDLRRVVADPESSEEMVFAESVKATAIYLNQLLSDIVPRDDLVLADKDIETDDANGELDLDDTELDLTDEEELSLDDDDDDLDDDLELGDEEELTLDDDLGLDDDVDMPIDDDDLGLDDEVDPLDDLLGGDDDLSTDDLLGESGSLNDSDDDLDFDL